MIKLKSNKKELWIFFQKLRKGLCNSVELSHKSIVERVQGYGSHNTIEGSRSV